MKKYLLIILFIFILNINVNAELIDGPANIREKPNGKVVFSLNKYTNVQSKVFDDQWYSISLIVWLRNTDLINGKTIKKNAILFEYQGHEIGQSLDLITPNQEDKFHYNKILQLYACKLTGYTYKENIQALSREKAKIVIERFHENPQNQAIAIANSKNDVVIDGVIYYYFEINFEKGTSAEVFINSKTGNIYGCDLSSCDDKDKVLGSINKALENNAYQEQSNTKIIGIQYKNQLLGITFTIPKSWEGKYRIAEDPYSITVYFLPKEKAEYENAGMLFKIVKRSKDIEEDAFDFLGNRYIKAKNVIYVIGGPTDVSFPDNHKEFKDFRKIEQDVRNIVATIYKF